MAEEKKQTILEKIIEQRVKDVAKAKEEKSLDQLKAQIEQQTKEGKFLLNNFHEKLLKNLKEGKLSVLGEVKRASPSKGDIALHIDAAEQGMKYALAGVTVISCLTEPTWFKGTLADLTSIRSQLDSLTPSERPSLLRKDFLIDEYQIYEGRAAGADTVLLIVAAMERNQIETQLKELIRVSRELGMEPLVEVNDATEMKLAVELGAKVIGINNRNLHDFQVDLSTTTRLVENLSLSSDTVLIALSGISNRRDVEYFGKSGVGAVLVGESLMRSSNPKDKILELSGLKPETLVKICGIMDPSMAIQTANAGADFIGLVFAKSKRQLDISTANQIVSAIHSYRNSPQFLIPSPSFPSSATTEERLKGWGEATVKGLSQVRPLIVGVFADNDLQYIQSILNSVKLDIVQLSGKEEYSMIEKIGVPCWKAIHVAENDSPSQLLQSIQPSSQLSAVLLDTQDPNARGGTGRAFDWSIAQQLASSIPFFLAGGLNPQNAASAVSQSHPFAVDVSSGVETEGSKDPKKISAFIQQCKQ